MRGFIFFALVLGSVVATKVKLSFRNQSDDYLSFHWIHPKTGETSPIKTDAIPHSAFSLNSFLSHKFEVRQEIDPETGDCGSGDDEECKIAHFQVTEAPVQSESCVLLVQNNPYGHCHYRHRYQYRWS